MLLIGSFPLCRIDLIIELLLVDNKIEKFTHTTVICQFPYSIRVELRSWSRYGTLFTWLDK